MRGVLKLTIGLAVLAGLLVGADRMAVGVAEGEAADKLVSSGRLGARPHVSIEGFPFLTQAAAGSFDQVRLSGDGVTVSDGRQQVALRSFDARLTGVSLGDGYRSATVRSASGSGLVPYPDVSRLIQGAQPLDLSYGGPGLVKASLAGVPVGQGRLHSSGNTITADGFQLPGVAALLDGAANAALGPRSLTLTNLPAGLSLATAEPRPDGLLLTFQGHDLRVLG
ncbi:DUF2993 domain-containing protein [Kitasatospora sp. NPDC002227]|uniref:LmeA family phospholipid-binding protein n=1 Tax=Kitasatospora sp. NPDC002227 TaxID=3154773 RepID=UPI003317BFFD